ncbi:MAG: ABC transporter permease [Actinobacteria bacterium]|nr:ABC transporter permease [Actinomycetota bacterium]
MTQVTLSDLYREAAENEQHAKSRPAPLRLLSNAVHLYRLRVREHPMQELLALIGIAAGVALLFAVQVASTSITGSLEHLAKGVTGRASLELAARGPAGIDQDILNKVKRLPSVKAAAPVLEQRITVAGPRGRSSLTLIGADQKLEKLGGPLVTAFFAKRDQLDALGFYMTSQTARQTGVNVGDSFSIDAGASKQKAILAGVLDANAVGDLTESPVALAPLGTAQRIAQMPGRISRILVEPLPGQHARASDALKHVANDQANARASDAEVQLLANAMKPDQQSSSLFSAMAVLIGLLFAFNAMLLAISRRKKLVAFVRLIGADRSTVLAMLLFDALALGVLATIVGIAIGNLLSHFTFQAIPEYLTAGFAIGSQRVVTFTTVALSCAGGLAATAAASLKPGLDLYVAKPTSAFGESSGEDRETGLLRRNGWLWIGLLILLLAGAISYLVPVTTPFCVAMFFFGLALITGPIVLQILRRLQRITRTRGDVAFSIAVDELVNTPLRTTALALISAGALTAIVSIGGARLDLERGADQLLRGHFGSHGVWAARGGSTNLLVTESFPNEPLRGRIVRLGGVRDAFPEGGAFLDIRNHRVRMVARSPLDPDLLIRGQVLAGDPSLAERRLRDGGWITMSRSLARKLDYKTGEDVTLPTPTGSRHFRLAAVTGNYGWSPGTIVMNTNDFFDAWGDDRVTALNIRLDDVSQLVSARRSIAGALGPDSAVSVFTSDQMINQRAEIMDQGLARLRQISSLVLAAGVMAIIAAMFTAVWQRRKRLAALRAIGMSRGELFRSLIFETFLAVFLGSVVGLAIGLFCQYFAGRWNELTSDFLSPYQPAVEFGLMTLAEAMMLTVVATAIPALLAAAVSPGVASSAEE